jgi:catechol 2,3-dioxygenase-like lactoylglutathione lyase family enzyme
MDARGPRPTRPNGVHHLAISTADIKAQIEFFNDVLGCELVALYWMHGVKGAWHGFLRLDDHSYVAFVQMDKIATIEPISGVTHAGNGGGATAAGTMQHVAFNVDSYDELIAMRDRIRSRGINVMGPIHHGMCDSIYFGGPEGLTLEVATSIEAIDGNHWIDPDVAALAGIDEQELQRYRNPAPFHRPATPLPNPPIDWSKPHMTYPKAVYEQLMTMPDADVATRFSEPNPPV